ncbi:ABC transporter ATP-binding protein [Solibacillus sp. CAU 1738]|uniref:ABC transporter ATP-binding protein n=1 Tax=Solibacillus sp. CAU 1738 TaxID=3140363 RepID=UPI0032600E58
MLKVDNVSIRYEHKQVVRNFSFHVASGDVVSIIGPNGSGKSTLLKAIARMLPYDNGSITLNNVNMKSMSSRDIAKKLCMLSQRNQAPNDISVKNLVSYGRYPHKKWFERLNDEDMQIVDWALEKTHLLHYKDRPISALSGGESQRAWIAMALAQRPQILLLDEPTTYLDISHQHEVLQLVRELNEEMGMTVVMVLHDLNQASSYSDQIVVIQEGDRKVTGSPDEVMTKQMIRDVYKMESEIQHVIWDDAPRIHLVSAVK